MQYPAQLTMYRSLLFLLSLQKVAFSYDDYTNWYSDSQCKGQEQSPINLDTEYAIPVEKYPLIFGNYKVNFTKSFVVENTGHSVKVNFQNILDHNNESFIESPFSKNKFKAVQLHFHWGNRTHRRSEHEFNGQSYDLEMHIVHTNAKYKTVKEAEAAKDGFAVVAVLFESSKKYSNTKLLALNAVFSQLKKIRLCKQKAKVTRNYALFDFVGGLLSQQKPYFRYMGSLTTKPYTESVEWFVLNEVVKIQTQVVQSFQRLMICNGDDANNNARDIQNIGSRVILLNANSQQNYIY